MKVSQILTLNVTVHWSDSQGWQVEEHKQRYLLSLEKASWKKQCTRRDLRAKEDLSKKIGKKGLARWNNVYKQRGVGNWHKDVEGDDGVKRIDKEGHVNSLRNLEFIWSAVCTSNYFPVSLCLWPTRSISWVIIWHKGLCEFVQCTVCAPMTVSSRLHILHICTFMLWWIQLASCCTYKTI